VTWSCQVPGCASDKAATTVLCWTHYARQRRHGDPMITLTKRGRAKCSVDWCEHLARSQGLCSTHRSRQDKGLPLEPQSLRRVVQPCGVEWCERSQAARGLCGMHDWRQRHGLPLAARALPGHRQPRPVKYCTVEGCGKPARYARFCNAHYDAQRRALRETW
jgi:hypothetical protein